MSGAQTQTYTYDNHGWRGAGTFGPRQTIGSQIIGTELLDASAYVGGFKADGSSEKMVAQGFAFRYTSSCISAVKHGIMWWFKSLSGDYPAENTVPYVPITIEGYTRPLPSPWVLIRNDFSSTPIASGACPNSATGYTSLATIKGNFIGIVRAEFYIEFTDFFHTNSYHLVSADEASVNPGWGLINVQNSESLVAAGEDLQISYDVGAACSVAEASDSGCGWTLSLRNRDTGATPSGWTDKTPADFSNGVYRVRVNADWFTLGQRNEYEVKLFNQVNLQDAKIFVTIDDRTLAPGTPTVTISPAPPYRQGNSLTITASATPNSQTNNAINDFHFVVRQGDRIFDVVVPAANNRASTTYVIPDEQVDVQVQVTAFDGERTGGVSRQILVVLDTDLDNRPPGDQISGPWIWIVLAIVAVILILVTIFMPLPMFWRIIMIGAAIIMLLVAYASATGAL